MNKTTINLLVVLGTLTIGFAVYYLINTTNVLTFSNSQSDTAISQMQARTAVFIERRQILNQVQYDFSLLENPNFINLENFRTPIQEVPVGRTNPFDEPNFQTNISTTSETDPGIAI